MSNEYDDEAGRHEAGPAGADLSGPSPDDPHSAEQDRVARILADAGGDEPMPVDVAVRMDALLASLAEAAADPPARDTSAPDPTDPDPGSADSAPSPTHGPGAEPPDELAARRRRRRWPQLLVAAAAVSVLGLGVGSLLDDLTAGSADSESAAGVAAEDADAAAGGGAADTSGPSAALRQQHGSDKQSQELADQPVETDSRVRATVGVPRLRTGSLAVDLQRAADLSRPADAGPALARQCVQPDLGPGDEWLRVRLDGARAVLVLRAADGGRRTAEVFTCDDADTPAASGRIEAR